MSICWLCLSRKRHCHRHFTFSCLAWTTSTSLLLLLASIDDDDSFPQRSERSCRLISMMLVNAAVQHRVKHFDLILSRELAFLQRQYEQHLITHDRFSRAVRHQTSTTNVSRPFKEIYNEETETLDYQKMKKKMKTSDDHHQRRRPSIDTSILSQIHSDVSSHVSQPSRRRHCTKAQPLPPISSHRQQQRRVDPLNSRYEKDLHWMSHFSPAKKDAPSRSSENGSVDDEIQSFLQTLPTANEIQYGFDSFAASSLYTTRASIAMRWTSPLVSHSLRSRDSSHVFTFLTFIDSTNIITKVNIEERIDQRIELNNNDEEEEEEEEDRRKTLLDTYGTVDVIE